LSTSSLDVKARKLSTSNTSGPQEESTVTSQVVSAKPITTVTANLLLSLFEEERKQEKPVVVVPVSRL
jgi:hypothetical protein